MSETQEARRERIKQLFASALSAGPAKRGALLEDACAGDAVLRDQVEQLLKDYGPALQWFADMHADVVQAAQDLAGPPQILSARRGIAT